MIQTKIATAVTKSIIDLRPYQAEVETSIYREWSQGHKNVLAVLPTGAGKTVLFSKIIHDHKGASCAIAHRQELVSQISLALARNGVRHRIIGPNKLIRIIVNLHMVEVGKSWYDPQALCAVAGVDTLKNRGKELAAWLPTVGLVVQDEAHHVLKKNKWGKACEMFENARGLFVTATPTRADGAGLGRHHDGLADVMVVGPTMRDLINMKYLTEYRIFAPPSDLDLSNVNISKATGDYNNNDIKNAVSGSSLIKSNKSKITGDVVGVYVEKFKGKLSVVFVPSVKDAEELERQFIANGIPAKSLNGNTPDDIRAGAIRKFVNRELLVLINVALFDEGTDIPALEVVQDAYPTQSYGRFVQRFGRVLRLMKGKDFGIYCDQAGNVMRHGLPDSPREWTLNRRDKRSKSEDDAMPVRTCLNVDCMAVYERFRPSCPYCHEPVPLPVLRGGPEFVDGDLHELDAETLAAMRGEVAKIERPLQEQMTEYGQGLLAKYVSHINAVSLTKKFGAKLENQKTALEAIKEIMAWWAGHYRAHGHSDSEIFKIFYLTFKIDWLTAQSLPGDQMLQLAERVAIKTGKIEL